jgi:hypothetical protein
MPARSLALLVALACAAGPPAPTGRVPVSTRRPREAEQGLPTLWIRGEVPGVAAGQVRFHSAAADGRLDVICLAEVVDGRFAAEAPPFGDPVYVSVVEVPASGPVGPTGTAARFLAAPLPLAGADHAVVIPAGPPPAWAAALRVEPLAIVPLAATAPR